MAYQYSEPTQPSSRDRIQKPTACHACGASIGARDRRLTWRIREGNEIFQYHYCSDACLPETAPELP